MMYPIEVVYGLVGERFDSVTEKMGELHNAHEILSLLLFTPAIVVEDRYDIYLLMSEAAEIGSIINCPE